MGAQEQGAQAVEGRWMTLPRTLCFVENGDSVLLMKRSPTRRVFPNRYNGLGGHIERDEDPLTSVRREVLEESGLAVRDVRLRAIYNIDSGANTGILLLVFTATSDTRDVTANVEGTLHWVPKTDVMTLDLVEDLPELLPRLFSMADDAPPWFVHVHYDAQDAIQMAFIQEIRKD
jgi:8-oxo-dGTP diphosphatase